MCVCWKMGGGDAIQIRETRYIVIDPVLRQITQIKFKMSNVFMDKFFFAGSAFGLKNNKLFKISPKRVS